MIAIYNLLNFFFPKFCVGCKKILPTGEKILCPACFETIKILTTERFNFEFEKKISLQKVITDFRSPFLFEKEGTLQELIHSLKYRKNFRAGIFLGNLISEKLHNEILQWNAKLIIPVPLHHIKKAERGYNQSYYIAKGIGKNIKLPVNTKILKRKKFTKSQTGFNLYERKLNMENAFICKRKDFIADKNIILVDDVITTGATITECAKVLKTNGAKNIYALSIAIAD